MCLLGDRLGVGSPGEVLCDVHPQEFSAADSLHSRGVDGQWGVVNRVSPEVHHNLLCLLHIEGQVHIILFTLLFIKSHYYLLSPSTLFFFSFFVHLIVFFAHLVVFLHISLSFAHLIVFCTSYCFALFYFITHFTLISPFLTICMPLCYVTYIICILIVLHCPLSGPDSIAFHF